MKKMPMGREGGGRDVLFLVRFNNFAQTTGFY